MGSIPDPFYTLYTHIYHSEYSNYCFTDYDGIDLPVRGEFKLAVSTIQ